jgi:hypothetical protein
MVVSVKFVKLVITAQVAACYLVLESTKTKLVKPNVKAVQLVINVQRQLYQSVVK